MTAQALDDLILESADDGSTAVLSADRRYRLLLTRELDDRRMTIVNLFDLRSSDPRLLAHPDQKHPPCSDANDDAIRRALRVAWRGADRHVVFVMLNPSTADAFRDDPTVRSCKRIAQVVPRGIVIAAWGAGGPDELVKERVARLLSLCHEAEVDERRVIYCLGETKAGHPRHPLFIAADTKKLRPWRTIEPLTLNPEPAMPAGGPRA